MNEDWLFRWPLQSQPVTRGDWVLEKAACLHLTFHEKCNYIVFTMKATIVKIGNSKGIRIPKAVFEQCGFGKEVELQVHNHELIIRSAHRAREAWDQAFATMAQHGDDELVDQVAESASAWDEEEWEW